MNNKKLNSLGKILIESRKSLNLTQQDIADKLCLKLDIIKNIEKDIFIVNIPWVFYCGYIYSYARLVNLSKDKIFPFLKEYCLKNNYNYTKVIKKKNFFEKEKKFLNSIFFFLIKFVLILFFGFYFFKIFFKI